MATDILLKLERTFHAPIQRVYSAWTIKQLIKQWHAPSADFVIDVRELDVQNGGSYAMDMQKGDEFYSVYGIYQEVEPEKLSFTSIWKSDPKGEMLITVTFTPEGSSTKLMLIHENFPSEESRIHHEQGWNGCLNRLEKLIDKI